MHSDRISGTGYYSLLLPHSSRYTHGADAAGRRAAPSWHVGAGGSTRMTVGGLWRAKKRFARSNSQIASAMSQSRAKRTYPWNETVIIDVQARSAARTSDAAVSGRRVSDQGAVEDERATQPEPRRIGPRAGPPDRRGLPSVRGRLAGGVPTAHGGVSGRRLPRRPIRTAGRIGGLGARAAPVGGDGRAPRIRPPHGCRAPDGTESFHDRRGADHRPWTATRDPYP